MDQPLSDVDRPVRSKTKSPVTDRWEDEARFIKTWLENPKSMGAVSPSGRSLCRTMARQIDPSLPGPIIELGPGTGPVTEALLRRGIAPERLILIEYEAAFCKLLARRYPKCHVVQGDAYSLNTTLAGLLDQPVAAVVSSLPLLTRPEPQRLALLAEAFGLMHPEAPFVQFTYGLLSPIPKHGPSANQHFRAKASAPVWLNLPPARVWVYRPASHPVLDREAKLDFIDKLKASGEKIGTEWREHRRKLRAEFEEARADIRARTERVRTGLEKRNGRLKTVKAEKRHPW